MNNSFLVKLCKISKAPTLYSSFTSSLLPILDKHNCVTV